MNDNNLEVELKKEYDDKIAKLIKQYQFEILEMKHELEAVKQENDIYKAKFEVVEMIFGGN